MLGLNLKHQHHQQVARLNKVNHLVQMTVSTRTGSMLSRIAMKLLLMWL